MDKEIKIAMDLCADYQYKYDPTHENKPSGYWRNTESGWSRDKENDVSGNPGGEQTPSVSNSNEENIFSEQSGATFVTDEGGKKTEQNSVIHPETTPEMDLEENDDHAEQNEYSKKNTEDSDVFSESNEEKYTSEQNREKYVAILDAFSSEFDNGDGKDNDVTFHAVASVLDWNSQKAVKAFYNHCHDNGIDGSDDSILFLYYMHKMDSDEFDDILAGIDHDVE